jgi:hypothetical protein
VRSGIRIQQLVLNEFQSLQALEDDLCQ